MENKDNPHCISDNGDSKTGNSRDIDANHQQFIMSNEKADDAQKMGQVLENSQ